MRAWKVALTVFIVLVLDQTLKFWIKLNMTKNEIIPVLGEWFVFHFVENPGMAFGLNIPGVWGKLALSIFRIFAIAFIIYYISLLNKKKAHWGLIFCVSLILAGAIGNMIDSAFYGLIFSDSFYHNTATLFPEGGGYGPFLQGKVVDMLKLNLIDWELPSWVPWVDEGARFKFFQPIFNLADSAITIGVFLILIFQKSFFKGLDDAPEPDTVPPVTEELIDDESVEEEEPVNETEEIINGEPPAVENESSEGSAV